MEMEDRKKYLIIGASSDIGMECIKQIAGKYRKNAKDAPLILAHYNSSKDALEKLASDLSSVDIIPIKADLTDENQSIALINQVEARIKYPNYILHFPAMKFDYMRYKEINTDYIRSQMNVQLFSFLTITRHFLPFMKKEYGNKVLVMLSSYVAQELPPKFMADYIITKYALLGAMKAAAAEFGNKNLKINAVSPIMMDTKFLDNMDPHIKELNAMESSLKRVVTAKEMAPHIMEMLDSGYIENGHNQVIDESFFEEN